MSLVRFRRIRVGLGSLFSCLLLLLGLFTLTGTASASITQTLHTHAAMPNRILCNDGLREDAKLSPGLASGLFCYVSLHKIWYGIHAASAGALVSCSTGEMGAFTFFHNAGGRAPPHIVCHPYPPNPSCEGTITVTFVHSHKNESPKLVCNSNNGDPFTMQFSPW